MSHSLQALLICPHGGAHLAIRAGRDPPQAGAGVARMVAGARRPLAAATARSEDRTRGRKGLVVGAALRRPHGRVGDGARASQVPPPGTSPISSDSDRGEDFFSGAWGWFALVVVLRRLQHRARRGAALPGAPAAAHARRLWPGRLGRQRGAVHGLSPARAVGHPDHLGGGIFLEAYPSRRFQSAWMGIIVHSFQSVFVIAVVLALVLK